MCIHVPLGLEKLKDNISPFRYEQTDLNSQLWCKEETEELWFYGGIFGRFGQVGKGQNDLCHFRFTEIWTGLKRAI